MEVKVRDVKDAKYDKIVQAKTIYLNFPFVEHIKSIHNCIREGCISGQISGMFLQQDKKQNK